MADLFDTVSNSHEPLAARMRPRNLDEYIGQEHIVGKGRLLRRAIAADQLSSVIFYGPPGTGKTTLARVIANHTSSAFITLNAVLTGVADIRNAISQAENQKKLYSRKTILFVDEVHRWNKSQQDALLPWVENGTIILIGATTENPFFEVNRALVSRSRVFQLKQLDFQDLLDIANQALKDKERGYGNYKVKFENGALEHLVQTANGDARSLLNALELAVETTPQKWAPNENPPVPPYDTEIFISKETAEESIQKKVVLYDRDGDYHYDIISAFIKSLRGRDPDAACYWLARMVRAGEDPHFIFRRMLISACEDTGLADPFAISVVASCAQAFDRVGLPEGRYFLAHAALYLSTAPKSNSSMAFFDALKAVEKQDAEVPNHLKDTNRDSESFGHGTGYLYPHAYRDHWVAQQYLPDTLIGKVFYTPSNQGYEAKIKEDVLSRREIQIAAILEKNEFAKDEENPINEWWDTGHFHGFTKTEENLTFSPKDKYKEDVLDNAEKHWRSRLDSNKAEILLLIRNEITQAAQILRHYRNLIVGADDGLLLYDIMRKSPEGITCGLCRKQASINVLSQYASTLDDLDKPHLALLPEGNIFENENLLKAGKLFDISFDRIFFRDVFASLDDIKNCVNLINSLFKNEILDKDAKVIFSQRIPRHGQKISLLIKEQILDEQKLEENPQIKNILNKFEDFEKEFFTDAANPLFSFTTKTIKAAFENEKNSVNAKKILLTEKRRLSQEDIEKWFSKNSSYGNALRQKLDEQEISVFTELLKENCKKNLFNWSYENVFICISKNPQ